MGKLVKIGIRDPHVRISDNASYTIMKDPIVELERAQLEQDHFKAMSYSCSVFELYGKEILVWHFKKNKTPVGIKKLENFSLESTIIMLYTHKIISDNTKMKMLNVKDLRNSFIHKSNAITLSSDQIKEAKRITVFAIECMRVLKKKYYNMAVS